MNWKIIPAVLICVFFSGIGMVLGAYLGGNYLVDLALFGVRGYEAAWPTGMMIGLLVGALISKQLLWKGSDSRPGKDDSDGQDFNP